MADGVWKYVKTLDIRALEQLSLNKSLDLIISSMRTSKIRNVASKLANGVWKGVYL